MHTCIRFLRNPCIRFSAYALTECTSFYLDFEERQRFGGWQLNEKVSPLPDTSKGMCVWRRGVLCSRSVVAECIALTVVCRIVAYPEQKAVQPRLAAITSSPYNAADCLPRAPKIQPPPGIRLNAGVGELVRA